VAKIEFSGYPSRWSALEPRDEFVASPHAVATCSSIAAAFADLTGFGDLAALGETVARAGGAEVRRYPSMDAPGNDAPWVRGITSVEQCESLCLADPTCAGYVYNVSKRVCIPKTAIGLLAPTRDAAITGIVERRSAGATTSAKPSFDCGKARAPDERALCGSSTLSRLDVELGDLYRARMAQGGGETELARRNIFSRVGPPAGRMLPVWNRPIDNGSWSLAGVCRRRLRLRKLSRSRFSRLRFSRRRSRKRSQRPHHGPRDQLRPCSSCPIRSA